MFPELESLVYAGSHRLPIQPVDATLCRKAAFLRNQSVAGNGNFALDSSHTANCTTPAKLFKNIFKKIYQSPLFT